MRIFSEKRVACVNFPHPSFHYRRDAFEEGLRAVGCDISRNPDPSPNPDDVLVCWNRYNRDESHCRRYEQAGGLVLIAENAWLGPEEKEAHHFALCQGHHNGAGKWYVGDRPRKLSGVELVPWRRDGHSIVVLPQRGMGERNVKQPPGWLPDVMERLHERTRRPVEVRYHPGPRPHPPIDFTGVWAAVTWASGAAIKAICAGIPVFHEFKQWIGAPAATYSIDNLEDCFVGDRAPMLHRLSWAQWTAEEIASGEPFKWLLKLG